MKSVRIVGASMGLLLISLSAHSASAQHRHRDTYVSSAAQDASNARHRHHAGRESTNNITNNMCSYTDPGRSPCGTPTGIEQISAPLPRRTTAVRNDAIEAYALADEGQIIGGRPEGCPHAYCGCGLRKYLGLTDERLNLASYWARLFPREAAPRPGLAAVRAHHVVYIESAAGAGLWQIRDYNSGGGLSRVHVGDLRGYIFVNPSHASPSAAHVASGS